MILGVSKNNLRQMVYRKLLTPHGRKNKKSLFLLDDVEQLKQAKALKKSSSVRTT
jgi:hypothetical protein